MMYIEQARPGKQSDYDTVTHTCRTGDYVDRGAWGLEVVLLLAALKIAAPSRVVLLR